MLSMSVAFAPPGEEGKPPVDLDRTTFDVRAKLLGDRGRPYVPGYDRARSPTEKRSGALGLRF